jgi:hypothetical protein
MARKLRPDEVQPLRENPDTAAAPVSEFETLLRNVIERSNDVPELTRINPAWIKSPTGPLPKPFGS